MVVKKVQRLPAVTKHARFSQEKRRKGNVTSLPGARARRSPSPAPEDPRAPGTFPGEAHPLPAEVKRHLKLGRRLFDPGYKMISHTVPQVGPEGLQRKFITVTTGLLVKAMKTFRSVQVLTERGLAEDAHGLVRPLCEVLAAVLHLRTDRERRAQDYMDYVTIHDDKLLRDPELDGMIDDATKPGVQARFAEMEGCLGKAEIKRLRGASNWGPGGSAQAMMKSVGLPAMHSLPFRMASRHLHAVDLSDHIAWRADGRVLRLLLPPQP